MSLWDKPGWRTSTPSACWTRRATRSSHTIQVETRPFLSAVSPDGTRLYVPNHDTDSVSVIDTTTDELITNIQVAPNPHWVAFTPDGTKAYTANHDSNLVSAIDPATNTVTATIPTPKSPHSIAVHPTLPLLIVACFDADEAAVIDTNTDQVITTVPVGPDPQFAAWSADGRFAYIVNNDDNTVSVIDGDDLHRHGDRLHRRLADVHGAVAGRQPGVRQQSRRRHTHRAEPGGLRPVPTGVLTRGGRRPPRASPPPHRGAGCAAGSPGAPRS